jgi:hypothetical protein
MVFRISNTAASAAGETGDDAIGAMLELRATNMDLGNESGSGNAGPDLLSFISQGFWRSMREDTDLAALPDVAAMVAAVSGSQFDPAQLTAEQQAAVTVALKRLADLREAASASGQADDAGDVIDANGGIISRTRSGGNRYRPAPQLVNESSVKHAAVTIVNEDLEDTGDKAACVFDAHISGDEDDVAMSVTQAHLLSLTELRRLVVGVLLFGAGPTLAGWAFLRDYTLGLATEDRGAWTASVFGRAADPSARLTADRRVPISSIMACVHAIAWRSLSSVSDIGRRTLLEAQVAQTLVLSDPALAVPPANHDIPIADKPDDSAPASLAADGSAGEITQPLPSVLLLSEDAPVGIDGDALLSSPVATDSALGLRSDWTHYAACCMSECDFSRPVTPTDSHELARARTVPAPVCDVATLWSPAAERWLSVARAVGASLVERMAQHLAMSVAITSASIDSWKGALIEAAVAAHSKDMDAARALTCTMAPPPFAPPPSPPKRIPALLILRCSDAIEQLAAACIGSTGVAAAAGFASATLSPPLNKAHRSAAAGMAAWDANGSAGGRTGRLARSRRDAALVVGAFLHGYEARSCGGAISAASSCWAAIHADPQLPFGHLAIQNTEVSSGHLLPGSTSSTEGGVKRDDGSDALMADDAVLAEVNSSTSLVVDSVPETLPPSDVWPRPAALQRRLAGLLSVASAVFNAQLRAAAALREILERSKADQRELERTVSATCRANDRAAKASLRKQLAAEAQAQARLEAQVSSGWEHAFAIPLLAMRHTT